MTNTIRLRSSQQRPLVVVADSDDDNAYLASQTIQGLGARTVSVRDIQTLLQVCQADRPALALLEPHRLPGFHGAEQIAAIKQTGCAAGQARVIALTSAAMPGDQAKYLSIGFDGYLSKPYRLLHLEELLYCYLCCNSEDSMFCQYNAVSFQPSSGSETCPLCSDVLLHRIRRGKAHWFCSRCYLEFAEAVISVSHSSSKYCGAFSSARPKQLSSADQQYVLCTYSNRTHEPQIARLLDPLSLTEQYFERVVLPQQRILFEAPISANLRLSSGTGCCCTEDETYPCRELALTRFTTVLPRTAARVLQVAPDYLSSDAS